MANDGPGVPAAAPAHRRAVAAISMGNFVEWSVRETSRGALADYSEEPPPGRVVVEGAAG
jgi:hypothetical protein